LDILKNIFILEVNIDLFLHLYLKDPIIEECFFDDTKKTPTEVDKKESKCEGTNLSFMLTPDTIGGLLVNMPQVNFNK